MDVPKELRLKSVPFIDSGILDSEYLDTLSAIKSQEHNITIRIIEHEDKQTAKLKAPISGYVDYIQGYEGLTVNASVDGAPLMTIIPSDSSLQYVLLAAPEYRKVLRVGQVLNLTLHSVLTKDKINTTGKIKNISMDAIRSQDTINVPLDYEGVYSRITIEAQTIQEQNLLANEFAVGTMISATITIGRASLWVKVKDSLFGGQGDN